jgi:hypothetical protein
MIPSNAPLFRLYSLTALPFFLLSALWDEPVRKFFSALSATEGLELTVICSSAAY